MLRRTWLTFVMDSELMVFATRDWIASRAHAAKQKTPAQSVPTSSAAAIKSNNADVVCDFE